MPPANDTIARPETAKPELAPKHNVPIAVGDTKITFEVAEGEGNAYFCLGVRKSGSTLLHKIVTFLAHRNALNVVDLPGRFFKGGLRVADWVKADLSDLIRPGNVFLGFRSFPKNFEENPLFQEAPKIFMFRDPRDAVVSQYFSDAYSHSLPQTEQGSEAFLKKRAEALETDIESYVMKHAKPFENTLMPFAPLLSDPTCLVLRYEDYVFQKNRMIHKILNHFGWKCNQNQIENLLQKVDEVPDSEDGKRFVRRVIPGDHRNKLKPETIRILNNRMKLALSTFDYY